MYFSGKVPNSVFSYLSRKSADLERFYEVTELPAELIKDPTCWLDAKQVETFLQQIEAEFGHLSPESSLISDVGMHCHELRSWGVLDSVLKMMSDPQDMFAQPQRILSYFISPAPPVANVHRSSDSISFDLPLAPEEYPYFSEYLKAAFVGLPQYAAKEPAHVYWSQTRMIVRWNQSQTSLFEGAEAEVNIKPELMRTLLKTLEDSQRELEENKRQLLLKDQQINKLKADLTVQNNHSSAGASSEEVKVIKDQCFRLMDYLGRAQQLVTLLVRQDRMDRQVKEAMRRVDWAKISKALPEIRNLVSESEASQAPQVSEQKQLTMTPSHQIDNQSFSNLEH
ncbi:MAG: hypothetical protein HRT45_02785 [Bdellovibrionales bacterium]|nr:hypothetical protein [Bdellovibrionales bacterium]